MGAERRAGFDEIHMQEVVEVVDLKTCVYLPCCSRVLQLCTLREDNVQPCSIALKEPGSTLSA